MSALAQQELVDGFSSDLQLAATGPKNLETRVQLAHWLIDIASDVHTILGHLHGDKKSQTGQDNEGEWISSPTLGTNELKSVR